MDNSPQKKRAKKYSSNGIVLPVSEDAEKGIISSILIDPFYSLPICETSITADYFHFPRERTIYETAIGLWREKRPCDYITILQRARDLNLLQAAGGDHYLSELLGFVPTARNIESYIDAVKQKKSLRIAIDEGSEVLASAMHEQDRVAEIPGMLRKVASKAAAAVETRINANLTEIAIRDLNSQIDKRSFGIDDSITGGIGFWDEFLHGIHPKRFYVIGARPKIGKSALIEQMAESQASQKIPIALFQRDMSVSDMMGRIACRKAGVIFESFICGEVTEEELMEIRLALEQIDPRYLRIHSPHNLTAEELASIVEREVNEFGVKVFYLDLFQRLKTKEGERVDGLTEAANVIRNLIQNTGV